MQGKNEAALLEQGGGGDIDVAANHRHLYSRRYAPRKQGPAHGKLSGIVWTKSVRASAHMLRTPKAWALDAADLELAEQCGARLVHIHDLEQLRHYWATLETIRRRGFAFDRGHGAQVALCLEHWAATRGEAEAAEPKPEPEVEPLAVQGALW